ncbi:MAG TPA: mechanosensitive ion channel family protein [Casimicrobiaceae bacterium]|nr:mechanosensitive ion channel family protein [Casimicrobiaceae bacterium]
MNFDISQATAGLHALTEQFMQRLPYVAIALFVFIVFYVAGMILRRLAARFTLRTRRHRSVGIVLGRLGQGILVLLGLLIGLVIAVPGFTPGQLVSVLGLSSVAIGFAFRDILQNFLAGILLLLSEPFRIGDQIKSGDFEGTVSNIETRATFIMTYDGRRIVVPNSTLFVNPVTVNTANERRRLEYDLTLPKETDIARVRRVLLGAIDSLPHVLRDPAPDVLLIGFTSKDLTLRLRWWVQPPLHFELQRGLDTVLARVRQAMLAESAQASAPPQPLEKESR